MRHYFADAEITCNAVKNGCKIEQVPIEMVEKDLDMLVRNDKQKR